VDTFMAGLQLARGVMLMVDYALERRQAKQLAADSLRAAELLTSLHLQDFPEPTAPVALSPPRRLRRFGRIDRDDQAAVEAAYAKDLARWELLCGHDPDEVLATVDDALADNASQSTCIDAGSAPTGNYVTLVVQYPGPEITEGIVQVGANTRPRSEKERTDLYRRAVASTVIASAKEALVCAPAATEAYVVVVRYDLRGRFTKRAPQLDAIYVGAINRSVLGMNWKLRNPVEVMTGARDVRINLDRKGRFKPLGDDAGSDPRALVAAVAAATATQPSRPRRRRYTRDECRQLMRSQDRQDFIATCTCPGCGQVGLHTLREPERDDPSWATVIRVCELCNREWAQA
jgi:hypothetical protein